MVTYYNKKDLVSFGHYLLSEERRISFENTEKLYKEQGMNPLSAEESLKLVHDADLANWMEIQRNKKE
ncbi:MAG: hypothetical protein WC055_02145 [Melioribacteraceae bacterium]